MSVSFASPSLGLKRCGKCQRTMPVDAFGRNSSRYDGLQDRCRDCRSRAKRTTATFTTYRRVRNGKEQLVTRRVDGHGLSKKTPLYKVWVGMRRRCHEPQAQNYRWYGGRGIAVCALWRVDFLAFYDWAMANGYESGMELDRTDNDGDYEPENCRWVVKLANLKNRSTYLPADVEARLRERAGREHKSVLGLIRQAVEEYLDRCEDEGR